MYEYHLATIINLCLCSYFSPISGSIYKPRHSTHRPGPPLTLFFSVLLQLLLSVILWCLFSLFIFESAVSLSVFALLIACFSACQSIRMATSPAGRMLTRQFQQMQSDNDSIPGISCGLVDNNVFEWEVMLMISDDVKLYGGEYHLTTWNSYRIQGED